MGEKKISEGQDYRPQSSDGFWISKEDFEKFLEVFQHVESSVQELDETLTKASSIVKVIEGISSKTDLLALNASIEAARAGQAGKGFAVVADDVSKLSEKTQNSIEDVQNVLMTIQEHLNQISKEVDQGKNSSHKVAQSSGKDFHLLK